MKSTEQCRERLPGQASLFLHETRSLLQILGEFGCINEILVFSGEFCFVESFFVVGSFLF